MKISKILTMLYSTIRKNFSIIIIMYVLKSTRFKYMKERSELGKEKKRTARKRSWLSKPYANQRELARNEKKDK